MFPEDVLEDIARGKDYYSGLNAENIANLESGCSSCTVKNYKCLKRLLRSLDYKVELDEYDDIAKELVKDMLIIIGDYTIQVPPTVDAGANQSVPVNQTATFNATIIPGSAAITNIQWSIVSGSGTLTNANTASVSVDDFPASATLLKIVVTDANGRTASDTVILTGTAATIKVYYRFQDTNVLPDEATVLASAFVNIVPDSDYILPLDLGNAAAKFVLFFEPGTETFKARWEDTIDSDNNGLIGPGKTIDITSDVGPFRSYTTLFKTQFPNPIKLIKGIPQP